MESTLKAFEGVTSAAPFRGLKNMCGEMFEVLFVWKCVGFENEKVFIKLKRCILR